jgi:site-specific DNA-methyltransferase (adenine-specific)
MALNIPADNGQHGPAYSLYADILQLAKQVGWQYKSEITWYQPVYRRSALGKGSASAPTIVNPLEKIMVLYKHQWERIHSGTLHTNSGSENLSYGFWTIDIDESQDVSPPLARLPREVPTNLLRLLSYKHDVVLDAFGRGGTVAVAAKHLGNPFIALEPLEQHRVIAQERLSQAA